MPSRASVAWLELGQVSEEAAYSKEWQAFFVCSFFLPLLGVTATVEAVTFYCLHTIWIKHYFLGYKC